MAREDVEVVRRMYEAFHGGDAERALAFFDPEVVVDASTRVDGGVGRGRGELTTILARWLGAWEDWREEIHEIRDLGRQVYVDATQRGRSRGSRLDLETRYGLLYELRGGRILRMTLYAEPADALQAAQRREWRTLP